MPPRLSRRLEAVLAQLEPCEVLADIGCDHGLVPLFAVGRGIARRAIGIDRAARALEGARANLQAARLAPAVAFRQADGLAGLAPGEADALTICGMGGQLAARLLAAAPAGLQGLRQIVTQPNHGAEALRHWARSHGYHLMAEALIHERNECVPILRFVPAPGEDPAYRLPGFSPEELEWLGPRLLGGRSEAARRYFAFQFERLRKLGARGAREAALFERAIAFVEAARPIGHP